MWVATMETEHFGWTAVDRTEAGALAALIAGWDRHMLRHAGDFDRDGFTPMSGAQAVNEYGASAEKFALGQARRDGTLI